MNQRVLAIQAYVWRRMYVTDGYWHAASTTKDSLEVAFDQVRRHSGKAVRQQKRLYD